MDENQEEIQKVLPQYHLLIQLIQNYQYLGNNKVFKTLADISHELQLMPLPFGLLPQELIYMVDHERIIPGVSFMEQVGDDFPLLNIYDQDLLKKKDQEKDKDLNIHQRALLFDTKEYDVLMGKGSSLQKKKSARDDGEKRPLFEILKKYK